MNINRRALLRGLFAAPAVITIERLMPVKGWSDEPFLGHKFLSIVGDGVHDDWPGLQGWLNGEDVLLPPDFVRKANRFELGNGIFRMSKGLIIPPNVSVFGAGFQTTLRQTILRTDPSVESTIYVETHDAQEQE